jgi:TPR repeat protein
MIPSTLRDANSGNPHASFSLGFAFTTGSGVPQDQTQAAAWYARAARQGHEQAATLLGSRYLRGIGVPQDDATAAFWFALGAERGDREALTALGLLYAAGRGVQRDLAMAVRLWTLAGSGAALRLLGDAHACGFGVELNPAQALVFYRQAPEFSGLELARMYRSGCGVPLDEQAAATWLRREADQGNPEAQIELGEMFEDGAGVERSSFEAYQWAALAAYRLPEGSLRARALALLSQAARSMGPQDVEAAETTVRALIDCHLRLP